MDNLFSWFDSFFDEVITNVNDVPLTNFILNQTNLTQGNQTNSSHFSYTMLSTHNSTHVPLDLNTNDNTFDENYHEENPNIIEENYYFNTQSNNSPNYDYQSLDDIQNTEGANSIDSIIQNANRLRILQELYTQTISSQPLLPRESQNIDYNYNINAQTPYTRLPNLDIFTPPSIEIPSQITDLLTLFFNDQLLNTLDTLEDVKVTLDQSIFDKLPEITFSEKIIIEEPCNICMEEYENGDILKKLPCNHYYHKDCISKWLCNEKTTCPMCRKDVRSAFETSDTSRIDTINQLD